MGIHTVVEVFNLKNRIFVDTNLDKALIIVACIKITSLDNIIDHYYAQILRNLQLYRCLIFYTLIIARFVSLHFHDLWFGSPAPCDNI